MQSVNFPQTFQSLIQQLQMVDKKKKPKLLVVDDEPDNLDLLYRTFRREFQVFKAENGLQALEVLAQEGEVAVIISDQRMPEMKGTEFLSKTVPQFPDTVRIILTGFTDVEDLVDAINSGRVYKYITKPWDPNELKGVVDQAVSNYEVLKQRGDELSRSQVQAELMTQLIELGQENTDSTLFLEQVAQLLSRHFSTQGCLIQHYGEQGNIESQGFTGVGQALAEQLKNDPLVIKSLENKIPQLWVDSSTTPAPDGIDYYGQHGLKMHFVSPILYRQKIKGVFSLVWSSVYQLPKDELQLLCLISQQVAVFLNLHP